MDDRSFGQLLDDYLKEYPEYESIFLYHDKDADGHVVITSTNTSYDYADVFSEDINLRDEIESYKKEIASLQAKIRSLKSEQKSIENAIKKLAKYNRPPESIEE